MSRIFFTVAALLAGVGVAARQAPVPDAAIQEPAQSVASTQQAEELHKRQVRSFAAVLRSAVEVGGQRLQKRILDMSPAAPQLLMDGDPDVLGVPLPDGGLVFTVQVPNILPSFLTFWQIEELQRRRRENARPIATAPPEKPVADDSTKTVAPEAIFEPDREYGEFVREGLIEAMVENSQSLAVSESGHLVVVASVPAAERRNPLDTSRSLILSIKGEDLVAYRQGRLTKDEVRARVRDRRF